MHGVLYEKLKASSALLNGLRKKHETSLRQIRVTAVAHREKDAGMLLASIDGLDQREIHSIGEDMIAAMTQISRSYSDVISNWGEQVMIINATTCPPVQSPP